MMNERTMMKSALCNGKLTKLLSAVGLLTFSCLLLAGGAPQASAQHAVASSAAKARAFTTAQEAADALIDAAEKDDEAALKEILGPGSNDIVHTGEPARDRETVTEFAALARTKKNVSLDPRNPRRASLVVGDDNWPFPVPIVKLGGKWFFDAHAGRQEILYRRVGRNELDAMQICRGYVDAQHEYALGKREGYDVNQYAQRIISTMGKQDGLAWQNADGTWGGPIGEKVAQAIEQGYSASEPYHGYFFKVLKGQGPDAPLGKMDFVVNDIMIGGFALVAAPARHDVTGGRTFIVSHGGVVYEEDLGTNPLDQFKKMELFNPDKSWTPVQDDDEPAASQAA